MHPLDRLIALESYQEILATLRPHELAVVALRLDGLLYKEIALFLGITERAVYYRLQRARDRLRAQGFGDKPPSPGDRPGDEGEGVREDLPPPLAARLPAFCRVSRLPRRREGTIERSTTMPTDVTVYDKSGQVQSLEWAQLKYGPFVVYPAPTPADGQALAWKLTALREKNDSTFIAHAASEAGKPVPGVRVCWYWPDAPRLDDAGPLGAPYEGITDNRAVSGFANVNGDVGFAMGPGATYFATNGERGPHAAWMHGSNTRSDVLLGIGMIPDDHLHLDATWSLVTIGSDDDTGEAPELAEALAALSTQLTGLAHAMQTLADALEAYANG